MGGTATTATARAEALAAPGTSADDRTLVQRRCPRKTADMLVDTRSHRIWIAEKQAWNAATCATIKGATGRQTSAT